MKQMTIGEVALRAGVGVETVRFYEREGLVPEPARSESGYRQFSPDTVERLRFVRHAKQLGFTLKEIGDLLDLRVDSSSAAACDEVRGRAQRKLTDVQERIAALRRIEGVLTGLIASCRTRAATEACPILEVLDEGDAR